MFLVELIASSFLDLISKQARRDAALSVFMLCNICVPHEINAGKGENLIWKE